MHCPLCPSNEFYLDMMILRAHFRVKHVDKGIDAYGMFFSYSKIAEQDYNFDKTNTNVDLCSNFDPKVLSRNCHV